MMNVLDYSQTRAADETAANEHTMTLEDGTRIFYRAWIPGEPTRKALVLFHRGHEHSGRLEDVVRDLRLHDIAVFAWDARGHGRSDGPRGWAPSFSCTARDADEFMRHISCKHGYRPEDTIVLGHSVGAVTVAEWVHDYAPHIRAMVLVTPALHVKLYVPFARQALRLMKAILRKKPMFVSSYVKGHLLTHDPEQARRYDDDLLISRQLAVNVLLELGDTANRLIADAAAIRTPALVLAGGNDWVVDLGAERAFFERLGSSVKRMRVFDGMYHDILHEKDRRLVLNDIRVFVRGAFAREETLQNENGESITSDEYERLRRPLAFFSPKRLWFAAQRAFMKTTGRLSDGISLGWRRGFDSGSSLDYVYENRARGKLLIGRMMDRAYLNSAGWAGIRQRKLNLERLLHEAIQRVSENRAPVRILDVATGQGRYVIDALTEYHRLQPVDSMWQRLQPADSTRHRPQPADATWHRLHPADATWHRLQPVDAGSEIEQSHDGEQSHRLKSVPPVTALLRDYDSANVEAARALAAERSLIGVSCEKADAFDDASYASLDPRPNIAIVSGLFELFSDNNLVRRCLNGIADAIDDEGYLIYTGQPWHPQIEMIARVLTNRDGEPWVMRRRTQVELDALIREAGFEKLSTRVDKRGIFTVSLAKRRRDGRS